MRTVIDKTNINDGKIISLTYLNTKTSTRITRFLRNKAFILLTLTFKRQANKCKTYFFSTDYTDT